MWTTIERYAAGWSFKWASVASTHLKLMKKQLTQNGGIAHAPHILIQGLVFERPCQISVHILLGAIGWNFILLESSAPNRDLGVRNQHAEERRRKAILCVTARPLGFL
jgi:hypothetical protein